MAFERIPKIDYKPIEQSVPEIASINPNLDEATMDNDLVDLSPSAAEVLVEKYEKTIQFIDWLTTLSDNRVKEITIQVDPDQHPEVWMAMQRIFSNPNTTLSGQSYLDVLDALKEIAEFEVNEVAQEAMKPEYDIINSYTNLDKDLADAEAENMIIVDEAALAIEEAAQEQVFDPTQKPKPKPSLFSRFIRIGKLITFRKD